MVMCSVSIDISIKNLSSNGIIFKLGTYKDGTYFSINDAERKAVDEVAEDLPINQVSLATIR